MTGDTGASSLAPMVASVRLCLERAADAGRSHAPAPASLDGAAPGLLSLAGAFALSPFEVAVLALCAAFELDTGIGGLCGAVEGQGRPTPSFALALTLFAGGSWDAMAPDGPLRAWRLVEFDREPGLPLVRAAIRCDERVMNHIKGLHGLDERLASLAEPVAPPAAEMARWAAVQTATLAGLWRRSGVALLTGSTAGSRQAVAAKAAAGCGRRLYRLAAGMVAGTPAETDVLVRLWQREDALAPIALLIEAPDGDGAGDRGAALRFVDRLGRAAAVSTDQSDARLAAVLLTVDVPRPGRGEQAQAWAHGLGDHAWAADLAGSFDLDLPTIHRIAAAQPPGPGQDGGGLRRLQDDCRAITRPSLQALAQRVPVGPAWDQLALPPKQRRQLQQIADQMVQRRRVHEQWGFAAKTSRGLGVTVLFAGESGTGKTMAAEILAGTLGLDLYRIDLSAMVSKYIGETEKNLRQIFDAAEHGGVALLFDEADALFGKRSDVKDSHDRFANVGISYLLQRLESFSGLAILTTNMKSALDAAFLRRLRFVVQFPYPGQAERTLLWRGAFPAQVPVLALDHDRLARLNLTGGNIANAALNAAFLAAAEGAPVGMHHVLSAARDEMLKLDRVMNEADFVLPEAPELARAAE